MRLNLDSVQPTTRTHGSIMTDGPNHTAAVPLVEATVAPSVAAHVLGSSLDPASEQTGAAFDSAEHQHTKGH